jgi:hypothetical protein
LTDPTDPVPGDHLPLEIFVISSPHCLTVPPMSNRKFSFLAVLAMAILALGAPGVQGAGPAYKLTGLVTVGTNWMALLEPINGSSIFLKEGEGTPRSGNPIVLRITPEIGEVQILYRGQTNDLVLPMPNTAGTNKSALLLKDASLEAALNVYQKIAKRTVLRSSILPYGAKINLALEPGTTREKMTRAIAESLKGERVFLRNIGAKIAIAHTERQSNLVAALPPPPVVTKEGEKISAGVIFIQSADLPWCWIFMRRWSTGRSCVPVCFLYRNYP